MPTLQWGYSTQLAGPSAGTSPTLASPAGPWCVVRPGAQEAFGCGWGLTVMGDVMGLVWGVRECVQGYVPFGCS